MDLTPFQTVGPYAEVLLRARQPCRQHDHATAGTPIVIEGALYDGAGEPIPDGLIETWQADAAGRYAHPEDPAAAAADPTFRGFGWCHTDEHGRFTIDTITPGAVAGPDHRLQAPHILIAVLARGVLTRYITRLYFADLGAASADDPILALVPETRRQTLIATPAGAERQAGLQTRLYRFDIRLQGPQETVFFDA